MLGKNNLWIFQYNNGVGCILRGSLSSIHEIKFTDKLLLPNRSLTVRGLNDKSFCAWQSVAFSRLKYPRIATFVVLICLACDLRASVESDEGCADLGQSPAGEFLAPVVVGNNMCRDKGGVQQVIGRFMRSGNTSSVSCSSGRIQKGGFLAKGRLNGERSTPRGDLVTGVFSLTARCGCQNFLLHELNVDLPSAVPVQWCVNKTFHFAQDAATWRSNNQPKVQNNGTMRRTVVLCLMVYPGEMKRLHFLWMDMGREQSALATQKHGRRKH